MKSSIRLFWIVTLVTSFTIFATGCPEIDETEVPSEVRIYIEDGGAAMVDLQLTAWYFGDDGYGNLQRKSATFQWKRDGSNIGQSETGWDSKYTPDVTGSYSVTASEGGNTASKSITVTPDTRPEFEGTLTISPATSVEAGTTLNAEYSGSETIKIYYQWNRNNTICDPDNYSSYIPNTIGEYTVTISATGIKKKTSEPVTVTLPATGIFDSSDPQNYLGKVNNKTDENCNFTTPTGYNFRNVVFTDPWKNGYDIYFQSSDVTGLTYVDSTTSNLGNKTVFYNNWTKNQFYTLDLTSSGNKILENVFHPMSRIKGDHSGGAPGPYLGNYYRVSSASPRILGFPETIVPPLVVVE